MEKDNCNCKVELICEYTKNSGKTYEEAIFRGCTIEECYQCFYDANRTLKWINDSWYRIKEKEDSDNYDKWYNSLSYNDRFAMYYGGGIVD